MKLAFILFMLGFMVLLSEQQRFPFHIQSRVIPPWAILDALSERDLYSYLIARRYGFPSNPSLYGQSNVAYQENNTPVIVQNSPFAKPEDQYVDTQSRNKFDDGVQQVDGSVNPRFLFNFVTTIGSTNSFYNPLQKTIYYFTTATTTFTFTTTCISTAQFTSSSFTLICRKRREMLEFLSALNPLDEFETPAQTSVDISPSNVQQDQVIPTAIPTSSPDNVYVASSKDEEELSKEAFDYAADPVVRNKRLFISTTIVTTYVFSTITSTRTLSANFGSSLSCRPSQFTYC